MIHEIATFLDRPGFNWKALIAGFTAANYIFDSYLTVRQIRHVSKHGKRVPENLASRIDEKTAIKSQDYATAKLKFSLFTGLFSLVENLAFIKLNVLPTLWFHAGTFLKTVLANYIPAFAVGPVMQSLVFVTQLGLISTVLSIPVSYYSNFVIEEKFGFNKLTVKLWLTDMLKESVVAAVVGFPILSAFLKIIDYFGDNFMYYLSVFLFMVQIFMIIVYPKFIQPWFNKLSPLEEGELKKSIEKLAADNKFPLDKLYVIDGSKRSSHSNAYFLGLPWGSKQIVIYDTLIESSTVTETTAVLGHEIGHWALSHTTKLLLINQLHIFGIFTLFAGFVNNTSLFQSFGFGLEKPILIGFLLFGDILRPVDAVVSFLMNLLSRKYEYEADEFSNKLGFGQELKNALITLHKENLSSLSTDWLFSAYHHSHPHLTERLRAIDEKKVN